MYLQLDLALGLQLVLNSKSHRTDDNHGLLEGAWCQIPQHILLLNIRRDVDGRHNET
jgi:hypothetical protein